MARTTPPSRSLTLGPPPKCDLVHDSLSGLPGGGRGAGCWTMCCERGKECCAAIFFFKLWHLVPLLCRSECDACFLHSTFINILWYRIGNLMTCSSTLNCSLWKYKTLRQILHRHYGAPCEADEDTPLNSVHLFCGNMFKWITHLLTRWYNSNDS